MKAWERNIRISFLIQYRSVRSRRHSLGRFKDILYERGSESSALISGVSDRETRNEQARRELFRTYLSHSKRFRYRRTHSLGRVTRAPFFLFCKYTVTSSANVSSIAPHVRLLYSSAYKPFLDRCSSPISAVDNGMRSPQHRKRYWDSQRMSLISLINLKMSSGFCCHIANTVMLLYK